MLTVRLRSSCSRCMSLILNAKHLWHGLGGVHACQSLVRSGFLLRWVKDKHAAQWKAVRREQLTLCRSKSMQQ